MISVFDIFKVGIGPSSSHTIGPFKSSQEFIKLTKNKSVFNNIKKINIELYGSLGATGVGHHTDKAVVLGLFGKDVSNITTKEINILEEYVKTKELVTLNGEFDIIFSYKKNIIFLGDINLPHHPNALKYIAYDSDDNILCEEIYYSIGGGFIVSDSDKELKEGTNNLDVKYNYKCADDIIKMCLSDDIKISDIVIANETVLHSGVDIKLKMLDIADVMLEILDNGLQSKERVLEGGLNLKRRAFNYYKMTKENDDLDDLNFVNAYALAVSEENASGGRIVTAPTNGAAGIIPAILGYITYHKFAHLSKDDLDEVKYRFLLTSAAIGILYQRNASISGADMGCQGEVGVACSMAAAGLAEVSGANIKRVCNAAEIGMEHNLGLTCDPVNGLVQVPCIERNTFGATKAINAVKLALFGDGESEISLDDVIDTMYRTGKDMSNKYKETSKGGLACIQKKC